MRFINEHKQRRDGGLRWGVESICAVLCEHGTPIAPSTYYEAAGRAPSKRALRDEDLMVAIARVRAANYDVYGPRKVWLTLNREGIPVARCTVERLMKDLQLKGIRRGRQVVTTRPDPKATRPADLVNRRFRPLAPNRLWVADYTYVSDLVGDGLRRVRHRRLQPRDRRVAVVAVAAGRPRPGRLGDGDLGTPRPR